MSVIKRFFVNLYMSFINIYDDKGVRESYGDKYADELAGADPVTGQRRVSILKVLFRIVIVVLFVMFAFFIISINTRDSFWL